MARETIVKRLDSNDRNRDYYRGFGVTSPLSSEITYVADWILRLSVGGWVALREAPTFHHGLMRNQAWLQAKLFSSTIVYENELTSVFHESFRQCSAQLSARATCLL